MTIQSMNMEQRRRYWLRKLIASRGTTAQLVRETDENAGMLSALVSEKKPKTFGEKLARGLEQRMGLDEGYFDRPIEDGPDEASFRPAASRGRWIPVVGEARLGDGGSFEETSVTPGSEGFVLSMLGNAESYALKCKGDSMRDAIMPGDYVVVVPKRRIGPSDWVMCQTTDGRRMIKTFAFRRDEMVELRSVNNDYKPITLDESQIKHLHFADGPVKASYHDPLGDGQADPAG